MAAGAGTATYPRQGEYANPLAHAKVTGERVDMGVDFAGTGQYTALARGVVTRIAIGAASGWPGNFIEYQITDRNSPLKGQSIYYAEGVNPVPGLKVGTILNPGDPVANLIPGWHSGTELGFGSGSGTGTYAAAHGGWTSAQDSASDYTMAGDAFNLLLAELGATTGHIEGHQVPGSTAPPAVSTLLSQKGNPDWGLLGAEILGYGVAGAGSIAAASGVLDAAGGGLTGAKLLSKGSSLARDLKTGTELAALGTFLTNPVPVLLTLALVAGGAVLVFSGAGRMLGFGSPVSSTVQKAKGMI